MCREIAAEGQTDGEWAEIEADDMFQSNYEDGYEAIEEAVTLSHYDSERREDWFHLTLAEVEAIAGGASVSIDARPVVPDS
jgi:hypothetical protein